MVSGTPPPPPSEPAPPPGPQAGPPPRRGFDPLLIAIVVTTLVVAAVAVFYFMDRSSDGTTTARPGTVATTTTAAGATTTTSTTTGTTGTDPSTTTTTTSPPVAGGDISADGTWTVMIYGLGDNNLEDALLGDLREMRAVTANASDLTFIALVDRSDEWSDESLGRVGDWTSTKLIEIAGDRFTELDDWGERNLGESGVLNEFIVSAAAAAPADHYALIFWDHGSMTGIGPDDSAGDVLEGWEIAAGLESGLMSTGIALDIIGFDACLMASLEVVSVVAPYATYMIASEELEPNEGWDYSGFGYLANGGGTVVDLGRSILDSYLATSGPFDPTVTLSMLDLREYDDFATAMSGFTTTALSTLDTTAVEIGRRRDKGVKFGEDPDPLQDWFMVDLGQLLGRLSRSETPLAPDAATAAEEFQDLVVLSVNGPASNGARGLSIHFPPAPDLHYPNWYEAFGDPVWADFLNGYFAAGRSIPLERQAAVVDASPNTTFFFDDYGLEVDAEIEQLALDSVVSAVLWSGIPEPDGSVTFYSSDQGVVEGGLGIGFYDLTQLRLSDGVDEAIAFQQLSINEDMTIVTMTVPMAYRAPVDSANGVFDDPIDVNLVVTYDLSTEEFTENVYWSSVGTVGAFVPEPDGLFYPVVPYQSADGTVEWLVTSEIGLWSDLQYLTYDFVDMASGTPLYAELTLSDYGGNTAIVYVTTEVP